LFNPLICFSFSVKWEGVNANGHEVERTFTILQSPSLGDSKTFSVLATQRAVLRNGRRTRIIDAMEFLFSVVGLPHFVVRYFARSTDSVEAGAIRHGLRKLIEYVPNPNNLSSGFQPGVNEVVQERYFWQGEGSDWGDLSVTESTDSSTGANIYTICSTNDIGVTVCVYSTDIWSQLTVNGSTFSVDPNAIHHSFDISNFPWNGTNTQLALKTHFEAITGAKNLNNDSLLDENQSGINLGDDTDNSTPLAAWNDTVSVTGSGCSSTADVIRSAIFESDPSSDTDTNINSALSQWSGEVSLNLETRIVYFSFLTDCNQPTDIFWDPEMGFVDTNFATIVYPSLSLLFLAILAIIF